VNDTCAICGGGKFCECGANWPAPVSAKERDPSLREYSVHVQPKFPAYDEVRGWDLRIFAHSKKEACRKARAQTAGGGHTGVRFYTATEINESIPVSPNRSQE
jgi:hypothetical protein